MEWGVAILVLEVRVIAASDQCLNLLCALRKHEFVSEKLSNFLEVGLVVLMPPDIIVQGVLHDLERAASRAVGRVVVNILVVD